MSGKQAEEIKTIKERTFKISLSDADVERLFDRAAIAGMSPSELLGSFIGDLVSGTYSNGSDERMYASAWFERCGFEFGNKSFLRWLVETFQLEDVAVKWDDLEDFKSDLENYDGSEEILSNFESIEEYEEEKQAISSDIEEYEKEIRDIFNDYVETTKKDELVGTKSEFVFEDEMKKVVEFYKERERVKTCD